MTYFERPAMPADNYTQLPNHWARDPRLSDKAKGRLWSISTHAAGYRLTIAQMIAETKDGREAVYSSLAELVKFGYLVREQLRRPDGKLGEVRYTYGPACTEQAYVRGWGRKNDVSAGETAYGFPVYGEAVSGESASKKLSSKKIKEKTSSSLSSAPALPQVGSGQIEEEEAASPETPTPAAAAAVPTDLPPAPVADEVELAEPAAREDLAAMVGSLPAVGGKPLTVAQRRQLASKALKLVGAGWTVEKLHKELSVDLNGAAGAGVFFARLAQLPKTPPAAKTAGPGRLAKPPWCGSCDERTRQAHNEQGIRRCPNCHPLTAAART